MSLVERALRKMHESRGGSAAEAAPVAMPVLAQTAAKLEPALAHRPAAEIDPSQIVRINRDGLRAETMIPAEREERVLAEQYRHIKRPILANAFGRGGPAVPDGRLLMVASALAGEGKTFTSINLALSMALEKDISVLLVDADVAKPRVSTLFGLAGKRGLLDLLREESSDIDSVVLQTDVPGLSILPAGTRSELANELLASKRMQQFVGFLGATDPNRIVLFDSPPLLLTNESRVLATVVGQIALVVRAGATPQQAVLDALDLIGDSKPTGLILNQADEPSRTGYYQYYGERPEGPQEQA
jgi:exopolysaccharide/PEP-CTERM locus tyrosine autokinase